MKMKAERSIRLANTVSLSSVEYMSDRKSCELCVLRQTAFISVWVFVTNAFDTFVSFPSLGMTFRSHWSLTQSVPLSFTWITDYLRLVYQWVFLRAICFSGRNIHNADVSDLTASKPSTEDFETVPLNILIFEKQM